SSSKRARATIWSSTTSSARRRRRSRTRPRARTRRSPRTVTVKTKRKLVPRDDRVTINHEFASVEEFLSEYASDISRSGVFLRARKPLPVGTKVNLRFTLIAADLETIEGIGEVVRVQESPRGMGVVFVTLTKRSQDAIERLVASRREGA